VTIVLTKEQGVCEVANIVRNASEKEEIMKVQTRPAFIDNINTSKAPSKLDTATDKTVELQNLLAVLLAIPVIVNLVQNQFGTNPLPIWRFAIVLVFISALILMLMQWTKLCTPSVTR